MTVKLRRTSKGYDVEVDGEIVGSVFRGARDWWFNSRENSRYWSRQDALQGLLNQLHPQETEVDESEFERISKRIQKVVQLTRSNNPNESAAASAKAQELLFKYNLDLASLNIEEEFEQKRIELESNRNWRRLLCFTVSRHNWCEALSVVGRSGMILIGRSHNVKMVEFLFTYLSHEIQRLADEESEALGTFSPSWRNSFYRGAVSSIDDRLSEQRQKDSQTSEESMALVVREDLKLREYLSRVYPNVRQGEFGEVSDPEGFWAGYHRGEGIALNPPVRGRENTIKSLES